ncbi:hypothetical protein EJF36_03445 [Bacillus sp. HMF5848]|uniref:hypothetical protein n=1 Tax=Bacillus sp. HMF5848 TaxID=2495421 RepID=UPI000F77AF64|nr:hypothetical protein [Bacillus sp. HMF5848]RSK26026.1 hypothetical protein EJF36_03445 [Bacillus sp. HMF5848]
MRWFAIVLFVFTLGLTGCSGAGESDATALKPMQYVGSDAELISFFKDNGVELASTEVIDVNKTDANVVVIDFNMIDKVTKSQVIYALSKDFVVYVVNVEDSKKFASAYLTGSQDLEPSYDFVQLGLENYKVNFTPHTFSDNPFQSIFDVVSQPQSEE